MRPTRLLTDASELAVSAILEQPDDAVAFHPVAFGSKGEGGEGGREKEGEREGEIEGGESEGGGAREGGRHRWASKHAHGRAPSLSES